MPAPQSIQTTNGGAHAGEAEAGDSITFTFASVVNPDVVLSGWDGTATAVTFTLGQYSNNDYAVARDASNGSILWSLGAVGLNQDYVDDVADFTNSQMTASGSTVTIVLGTRSGSVNRVYTADAMTWYTYHGIVTESGLPDLDF
jgi:hypothetical protein